MNREDLRVDSARLFSETFSDLAAGMVGSVGFVSGAISQFIAGMVESAEFSIVARG